MGNVIVIAFSTLDGFVSDPDGSAGTATGGWAFRHGPDSVAGDKFRLGPLMDSGVMLLGRRTWELFSRRWPNRTSPFADRMNAMRKLVVTKSGVDTAAWSNSVATDADPVDVVGRETGDVVVTGSVSVVHRLIEHDLVDEYRLLTFPSVIGAGERLFPAGIQPGNFTYVSAEPSGAAVLSVLQRVVAPRSTASTNFSANPSSGT
jgi:dihydrofolate reductase